MKNNKGFSLVGAMVSLVVISMAFMALASLMHQTMLSSNAAEARASLTSLAQDISGIASNDVTCTNALTHTNQVFNNELEFYFPNDVVIKQGTKTSYPLNTLSFTYTNYKLVQDKDGNKTYYGDLSIQVSPTKQAFGPKTLIRQVKSVFLTINSSSKIMWCGTSLPTDTKDDHDKDDHDKCDRSKGDHNHDGHPDNGK
jgi:hypothetical protein